MKILSKHLKYAAAAFAVLFALAFAGCNAAELSSLRSFAKPYIGAYECTEARFGGRDLLQEFPSVVLNLLFTATVRGKTYSKNVAMENGCFVVEQMFAGKKLFLKFEVKG